MRSRVLTAAVLLALAPALTGCGSDDPTPESQIQKVTSPGEGWMPGGQGITSYQLTDKDRKNGIWASDDGMAYFTGWEIVVQPGHEGQRCEQAARWLKKTGSGFTGNVTDPGAKMATLENTVIACLSALKPQAADGASTIGFAHWPQQSSDDYGLNATAGAQVKGSQLTIYVAANAIHDG